MKIIFEYDGIIYWNVLGELVFFKKNSVYTKWLNKTHKQRVQSLRDRGLL